MPQTKSKAPVKSVNGKINTVVLDQDDIDDTATFVRMLPAERVTLNDVDGLSHTQDTDTKLDDGQPNEVTAAAIRLHLDDDGIHFEIDDATPASDKAYSSSFIQTELDNLAAGLSERLLPAVQDITELKAIDTTDADDFKDKTLINVEDNGLYRLDRQSSATEEIDRIVEPTVGVGRWIKMTSSINDHNNLSNIQGGTTGQHYHITLAELNVLQNTSGTNTGNELQATEILKGVSELLTQAETDGGADDLRILTAKKLKAYANSLLNLTGVKSSNNVEATLDLITGQHIITPIKVFVGPNAPSSQGDNTVAIGIDAGNDTQGNNATALGRDAGKTTQGTKSTALGYFSGKSDQGNSAVAVGDEAGKDNQGNNTVAVGVAAGKTSQSGNAVAIGNGAGEVTQGSTAVAVGKGSGNDNQGTSAVAIGDEAGRINQSNFAVAVGQLAGDVGQGVESIAVGRKAGRTNQGANGIIVSSTGNDVNETSDGHIVIISSLASIIFNAVLNAFSFSKGIIVNGTANLAQGIQIAVNVQSGDTYQILKADHFLVGDNTSNDVAFTLPAIIDDPADDGRLFVINKFENGEFFISIESAGAETINGETTDIRMGLRNDSITLIASGGNWFTKQRNTGAFCGMNILAVPTSTQAIGSVTPVVVNGFDNVTFETPGILSADETADTITVEHVELASSGGDGFIVGFQLEIDYSLNNQELLAEIYLDGVATGIQDLQPTSNAFNTLLKAESIIQIPGGVPGVLDVRLIGSSAGNAIYHESNFVVQRLTK